MFFDQIFFDQIFWSNVFWPNIFRPFICRPIHPDPRICQCTVCVIQPKPFSFNWRLQSYDYNLTVKFPLPMMLIKVNNIFQVTEYEMVFSRFLFFWNFIFVNVIVRCRVRDTLMFKWSFRWNWNRKKIFVSSSKIIYGQSYLNDYQNKMLSKKQWNMSLTST